MTLSLELGKTLYEQGVDLPRARVALEQAVRETPDDPRAHLYRALVVLDLDGLPAAREGFETALRLQPNLPEAHRFYAQALAEAGEVEAADKHFREALTLDPRDAEAAFLDARLLRRQGENERAVSLLQKAAALDPKSAAHHELAEMFLLAGDPRAEAELRADLTADPTCQTSARNLGAILLDRGDAAGARDAYAAAVQYHPDDARALLGLGRAYLALGDAEMAVASLRRARDLGQEDAAGPLRSARWRLRLEKGWPLGIAGVALGAAALLLRRKRVS